MKKKQKRKHKLGVFSFTQHKVKRQCNKRDCGRQLFHSFLFGYLGDCLLNEGSGWSEECTTVSPPTFSLLLL